MATALDFSAGVLKAATIKAAGHVGVIRYVGTPGRTKNITKAEYDELNRNGIDVALVYENKAGDANGGFSEGVNAARAARANADAIGWPKDRPIYFAVDSDQVTALDFSEVVAYLDGAASVLGNGIERIGVYGEYDVIERNVGSHARYGWQTVAWSGGRVSSKAHLFQRLGQIYVGGIQVDVNNILAADWGQQNAQEDDMPTKEEVQEATEVGTFNALNRYFSSNEVRFNGSNFADLVSQLRNSVIDLQTKGEDSNEKVDLLIAKIDELITAIKPPSTPQP